MGNRASNIKLLDNSFRHGGFADIAEGAFLSQPFADTNVANEFIQVGVRNVALKDILIPHLPDDDLNLRAKYFNTLHYMAQSLIGATGGARIEKLQLFENTYNEMLGKLLKEGRQKSESFFSVPSVSVLATSYIDPVTGSLNEGGIHTVANKQLVRSVLEDAGFDKSFALSMTGENVELPRTLMNPLDITSRLGITDKMLNSAMEDMSMDESREFLSQDPTKRMHNKVNRFLEKNPRYRLMMQYRDPAHHPGSMAFGILESDPTIPRLSQPTPLWAFGTSNVDKDSDRFDSIRIAHSITDTTAPIYQRALMSQVGLGSDISTFTLNKNFFFDQNYKDPLMKTQYALKSWYETNPQQAINALQRVNQNYNFNILDIFGASLSDNQLTFDAINGDKLIENRDVIPRHLISAYEDVHKAISGSGNTRAWLRLFSGNIAEEFNDFIAMSGPDGAKILANKMKAMNDSSLATLLVGNLHEEIIGTVDALKETITDEGLKQLRTQVQSGKATFGERRLFHAITTTINGKTEFLDKKRIAKIVNPIRMQATIIESMGIKAIKGNAGVSLTIADALSGILAGVYEDTGWDSNIDNRLVSMLESPDENSMNLMSRILINRGYSDVKNLDEDAFRELEAMMYFVSRSPKDHRPGGIRTQLATARIISDTKLGKTGISGDDLDPIAPILHKRQPYQKSSISGVTARKSSETELSWKEGYKEFGSNVRFYKEAAEANVNAFRKQGLSIFDLEREMRVDDITYELPFIYDETTDKLVNLHEYISNPELRRDRMNEVRGMMDAFYKRRLEDPEAVIDQSRRMLFPNVTKAKAGIIKDYGTVEKFIKDQQTKLFGHGIVLYKPGSGAGSMKTGVMTIDEVETAKRLLAIGEDNWTEISSRIATVLKADWNVNSLSEIADRNKYNIPIYHNQLVKSGIRPENYVTNPVEEAVDQILQPIDFGISSTDNRHRPFISQFLLQTEGIGGSVVFDNKKFDSGLIDNFVKMGDKRSLNTAKQLIDMAVDMISSPEGWDPEVFSLSEEGVMTIQFGKIKDERIKNLVENTFQDVVESANIHSQEYINMFSDPQSTTWYIGRSMGNKKELGQLDRIWRNAFNPNRSHITMQAMLRALQSEIGSLDDASSFGWSIESYSPIGLKMFGSIGKYGVPFHIGTTNPAHRKLIEQGFEGIISGVDKTIGLPTAIGNTAWINWMEEQGFIGQAHLTTAQKTLAGDMRKRMFNAMYALGKSEYMSADLLIEAVWGASGSKSSLEDYMKNMKYKDKLGNEGLKLQFVNYTQRLLNVSVKHGRFSVDLPMRLFGTDGGARSAKEIAKYLPIESGITNVARTIAAIMNVAGGAEWRDTDDILEAIQKRIGLKSDFQMVSATSIMTDASKRSGRTEFDSAKLRKLQTMVARNKRDLLIISPSLEGAEILESELGTGEFNIGAMVGEKMDKQTRDAYPNFLQTHGTNDIDDFLKQVAEEVSPTYASSIRKSNQLVAAETRVYQLIDYQVGGKLDGTDMFSNRVNKAFGELAERFSKNKSTNTLVIAGLALATAAVVRNITANGEMKNMDRISDERYNMMREMSGYDKPAPKGPHYYKSQPAKQQIAPTNRIIVNTEEYVDEDKLQQLMLDHIQLGKEYFK